jgi:predicted HTH domain antitoxin
MATVTIDLPDTVFSALRLAPNEFAREMRIAAVVQWYAQEKISQEKAAEIAGLNRVEFLEELYRRKVPAIQVTLEDLKKETDGAW